SATFLWGWPMLIFLSSIGIYFSLRLNWLQFSKFFTSGKLTYKYRTSSGEGNITPLQSFFSALGGIIGNGNLAGVATAIAIGGPGALFWLWISSFVAMIIVYSETLMSLLHREKGADGTYSGGPMYYIEKVLKLRWLAVIFAFGMGFKTLIATSTVQSNSISLAANASFDIPMIYTCIGLAFLTWLATIGGIKTIAKTLEKLTPLMVILFLVFGSIILVSNASSFVDMIKLVVAKAFTPAAETGGFAGASVMLALRYGVARGFYSNEAGTGSSPIMFATAKSDNPVKQSLIGMFGVVIDTLVGTLTAFTILITGVWSSGDTSTALTTAAFSTVFSDYGGYFVFLASFLLGYSTLIAWCFYGEQCFVYIFGPFMRKIFRWAFCIAIIFGYFETESIWSLGDLLNAFTVLINVCALIFLIKYVVENSSKWSIKEEDGITPPHTGI
ncbi:alanine/glycine:cation symporter family protein, partial [candidate division KSB1 bacterium]